VGHRFEALADDLDPEAAQVEDLAGLRAIAEAAERARRDEALSPNGSPWPGRTGGAGAGSPPWGCPGKPPASGSAARSERKAAPKATPRRL